MFITVNMGLALQIAANMVVIVAGAYGLWRFLKRQWQKPVEQEDTG